MKFLGWLCIFCLKQCSKFWTWHLWKPYYLKDTKQAYFLEIFYYCIELMRTSKTQLFWHYERTCVHQKMPKNDRLISKLARAIKNNAISKPNISLERAGQELYDNMRENFSSLILTTKIEEERAWGLIPGNPISSMARLVSGLLLRSMKLRGLLLTVRLKLWSSEK